ncbi:unnamed protein product [Alopecurus aequalis]
MPPRRSTSGFRGVRRNGTFHAKIRPAEHHLTIGMCATTHEAAHAYDGAEWRLGRAVIDNFRDVNSVAQAMALAPPPYVVTQEERRVTVAEADECAMAE